LDDGVEDGAAGGLVENAGIGVGTHASGVRTFVVIEDAFVILRRFERNGCLAVAQGDETHFLAFEKFLDDHGVGECGECIIHFGAGVRDYDTFAGRETVGFQDTG